MVSDPNLFEPGRTGAVRGRFGGESRGWSAQMTASKNPLAALLSVGAVLGVGAGLLAAAALSPKRR